MKKVLECNRQCLIHTVKKHSDWWNLWDQSFIAAYFYHLWVLHHHMEKKIQTGIIIPLERIWKTGWIYHIGKTTVRQWQSLIQPWRKRLELQGVIESFILMLITLMPVLQNGYLVTLGLVLYLVYHGLKRIQPIHGLIGLMGLFLTVALLSPGYRYGWGSLIGLLNGLLIAYIIGNTFSEGLVKKSIHSLVIFSTIFMIVGFSQKWADIATPAGWLESSQIGMIGPRIFSIFNNPNIYAIYLVGILVLSSHLWLGSKGWPKWAWGMITTGVIFSLYFTYSRSGWLIGLIYLGWFLFQTRNKKLLWFVLTSAFLVMTFLVGNEAWARLSTLSDFTENSLGYRGQIWEGTVRALSDFWLWGAGPGGFTRVYPWYQMANTFADHAHQWYLQFWLEYGLLGITGFSWFIVHLMHPFPASGWQRILGVTIICFLGFGLVESWYVQPFLWNYFWLLTGMFIAIQREGTVFNG